jgi:hypothetical protein
MKLYCPLCKRKVEVTNVSERMVLVNHGYRKLAEGTDAKGHKVAQFVSANPAPIVKKKKKKRNTGWSMPF